MAFKHKLTSNEFPSVLKLRRLESGPSWISHDHNSVNSLFDISAKVVAEFLPFEYVEKTLVHIPEPVQERIIYYSFPRRNSDIYTYASFHPKADKCGNKIPYYEGLDYFQNGFVENAVQIGFHLTGSVQQPLCGSSDSGRRKYEVSITFDRCKIISVCCDCGNKGLSWCPHVVALALFRIRQPHLVHYRSPISDALVLMDRSQLQKFAQYLIASHPNKVLPSAQLLADQLLQPESNINQTSGAPDPTAGASVEDVAAWYLDEAGVREQLRVELANLASFGQCISTTSATMTNVTGTHDLCPPLGGRSTPNITPMLLGSAAGLLNDDTSVTLSSQLADQFNQSETNRHVPPLQQSTDLSGHSPSTQVALDWLSRYRRLLMHQNLFNPTLTEIPNCTNTALSRRHTNLIDLGLPTAAESNASARDWFIRSSSALASLTNDNPTNCALHSAAGSQITAMFSKVHELLAKHDSNGPRLLSLITEELLRCPKLSLLKARRSHRGIEPSTRPLRSSVTSPTMIGSTTEPSSSTNSFTSSPQSPNWTTRLWEEVCVLWTCIVLSPDCSWETKRQWRQRFLTWTRAHRCPRDEAYAVPAAYLSNQRDPTELPDEETIVNQTSTASQFHTHTRLITRRASIFQLPLEVSFMSWDHRWLRHLLGFDILKRVKEDPAAVDENNAPSVDEQSSIDLDSSFTEPSRPPLSFGGPLRRSNTLNHQSHPSTNLQTDNLYPPRDCNCPYCDSTTPLNEPFPLLCLRIAALRSNGYLTQALKLAVFVSQRLLQSFRSKVSSTVQLLGSSNRAVSTQPYSNNSNNFTYPPPPLLPPSPSLSGSHYHHSGSSAHSGETPIRRSLFQSNMSSTGRVLANGGLGGVYNSRYHHVSSPVPQSPIQIQGKFSNHCHIPSPRPSSISPPIPPNTIPNSRPGSRRYVVSPTANSNYSSASTAPPVSFGGGGWSSYNSSPISSAPYGTKPPPSPHALHLYGNHGASIPVHSNSSSPAPPPPASKHPPHIHRPSPPLSFKQSSTHPPRSLASPKITGWPPKSSSLTATPSQAGILDPQHDHSLSLLCGMSSTSCPSHSDAGWLGLPGRPIISLVECLMDAAALAIESGQHPDNNSQPWGRLEPASFYLCLVVKIGLLALLQQRRISGSVNRLLTCQTQEAKLLTMLHTMPKDTTTVLALCESLSYLLGPPHWPRLATVRPDPYNNNHHPPPMLTQPQCMSNWSWSALGPVVHPDSYPVHNVAHFVLDYVQEAQKHTQLTLIHNCWSPLVGNAIPVRIEDLLFAVITRSMRFSILEGAPNRVNLSPSSMRPSLLTSPPLDNTHMPTSHSYRSNSSNYNHPDQRDHSDSQQQRPNITSAVDGEGHVPPPDIPPHQHLAGSFDSISHHIPPHYDVDRWVSSHCPPLPSTLASSVQACIRSLEAFNRSGPPFFNNPSPSCYHNGRSYHHNHHHTYNNHVNGDVMNTFVNYSQNSYLRRCLQSFELQQTRLATALMRLSKSNLLRLDQTVQVCDRHVHSAISLLTVSQQIFAEAVGLEAAVNLPTCSPLHLFKSSLLTSFSNSVCQLRPPNSASDGMHSSTSGTTLKGHHLNRDRVNLVCTAFHLALLVVLRTSNHSVHWRRREMLAWVVSTALHVGPSACLYLISQWVTYVTPKEAVNCLAPVLLSVVSKNDLGSKLRCDKPNNPDLLPCDQMPNGESAGLCPDHALLTDMCGWTSAEPHGLSDHPLSVGDVAGDQPSWYQSPWYTFPHNHLTSRLPATSSITMAAQMLSSAIPFSKSSREHITAAVRHMALQAAARDPINCALPALTLAENNPPAFDSVYRLVLHSAESGCLGPIQLFYLARYMDNRGWAWRAYPFALHATRLFVLSTIQETHPASNHVVWACSLAHRLGIGALQELLNNVIRNIHCPTLLTEILHRCRLSPPGSSGNGSCSMGLSSSITQFGESMAYNGDRHHPGIYHHGSCSDMTSHNPTYSTAASNNLNAKTLSLDRPPLKGLLDAATKAFANATHIRLSNISPRQYAEFVDFLARARDTYQLLRPDGPIQFRRLVECLKQTYRGKRKLVLLLAERFG